MSCQELEKVSCLASLTETIRQRQFIQIASAEFQQDIYSRTAPPEPFIGLCLVIEYRF